MVVAALSAASVAVAVAAALFGRAAVAAERVGRKGGERIREERVCLTGLGR